jgi:hypothetical protein
MMATAHNFIKAKNVPEKKDQEGFQLINRVSYWLAGVDLHCFQ